METLQSIVLSESEVVTKYQAMLRWSIEEVYKFRKYHLPMKQSIKPCLQYK